MMSQMKKREIYPGLEVPLQISRPFRSELFSFLFPGIKKKGAKKKSGAAKKSR
jgi:hypothetical protein